MSPMKQADLVISGGMLVDPERIVANSIAVEGGKIAAIGPAEADAAGERAHRRERPPRPAGCHRRARALPRTRLLPQGNLDQRDAGRGGRRRHHGVRHAEHQSADFDSRSGAAEARNRAAAGRGRFRRLRQHRRAQHRPAQGDGAGRRGVVQALHGQRESAGAVPAGRRDPRCVRNPGRARHPLHCSRREHADPDLARRAADQVRPHRCGRASGAPQRYRNHRGREPHRDLRRMDRMQGPHRPRKHPAFAAAHPLCKRARRRSDGRDLPALSVSHDR